MQLVQVDIIGLQPAQGSLTGAQDMIAAGSRLVWSIAHAVEALGGQEDLLTSSKILESLANDALALTVLVFIGCVDEVDPCIQRPRDDCPGIFGAGGIAKVHRPQAERRYEHSCASKQTIFHNLIPF